MRIALSPRSLIKRRSLNSPMNRDQFGSLSCKCPYMASAIFANVPNVEPFSNFRRTREMSARARLQIDSARFDNRNPVRVMKIVKANVVASSTSVPIVSSLSTLIWRGDDYERFCLPTARLPGVTSRRTDRRARGEARLRRRRRLVVADTHGPRGRRLPRFNFSRSASGRPSERASE